MMETVWIANFCLFWRLIIADISSEFELIRVLSIHVKIIMLLNVKWNQYQLVVKFHTEKNYWHENKVYEKWENCKTKRNKIVCWKLLTQSESIWTVTRNEERKSLEMTRLHLHEQTPDRND